MKRTFLLIGSLLIGGPMSAQTTGILQVGDVNGDHQITIGDITRFIAMQGFDPAMADANGNGQIDSEDLQIIANMLLNEHTLEEARIDIIGNDYHSQDQHEYVNLGLPAPYEDLLWATCNVGASQPYLPGEYCTWDVTYPLSVDVAHLMWGGTWRTPKEAEMQLLVQYCTTTWVDATNSSYMGHAGLEVTGPNGNKLFLPAAGYKEDGEVKNAATVRYWSCTTSSTTNAKAALYNSGQLVISDTNKLWALQIRPVCFKKESIPVDDEPGGVDAPARE